MDASVTFACVLRSGGVYDAQWVDRLCVQVITHLKPTHVVCLSNILVASCECQPLEHNWPGYFSKMELFRPGLFSGRVFYSDLDSLFLAPIDLSPVWAKLEQGPEKLAMLSDFFTPKIPASGVMAWIPCSETEMIYRQFVSEPQISTRWDRGDGYHIGRHPHVRLQDLMPATFASYKANRLQNTHAGFPHVSFHGKPKQNDLPVGHWAHRAWCGRTPTPKGL